MNRAMIEDEVDSMAASLSSRLQVIQPILMRYLNERQEIEKKYSLKEEKAIESLSIKEV